LESTRLTMGARLSIITLRFIKPSLTEADGISCV